MYTPVEPEYSCGHFDDAIKHLELARKANEELREWGRYEEEKVEKLMNEKEDLELQISFLRESFEAKLQTKEEEIEELKTQIEKLKDEQL